MYNEALYNELIGVVQTVTLTGIASSEAIGSPTITTGVVAVTPNGIPSAEVIGTPAVAVGSATVTLNGIASTETFGTPVLTTGAISVPVNGIPSAEAFGIPRLRFRKSRLQGNISSLTITGKVFPTNRIHGIVDTDRDLIGVVKQPSTQGTIKNSASIIGTIKE